MIFALIIASIFIVVFLWIVITQTNASDCFCSIIVRGAKRYRCRRRPKRLFLIRHGESQANQDSKIYSSVPDHAIGLTDKGREQAHHCGEELRKLIGNDGKITCYVSPFRRSKETCELICQAFPPKNILKVREDPRIREQEWGNFQNHATREITVAEREKIGRFFYRFKEGESGADVYDRVGSFMDSLFREMESSSMPDSNILIVSHGLFIRLFLMRFYRWPVEKFHTLENFDNCGYCILERSDEDGSYILKSELKTSPEHKPTSTKSLEDTFNQRSFNEEVNPSIHTENIGQNEKKND
jgi:broad specificity phosphatase PhoE